MKESGDGSVKTEYVSMGRRRRSLCLSKADIAAAKKALLLRAECEDELVDDLAEDYPLRHTVTLEQAEQAMQKRGELIYRYEDGTLFAIELARDDHGKVAGTVVARVIRALPDNVDMDIAGGVTMNVANGQRREPDESLTPIPRHPGITYPTAIVEVAVSQSLISVYRSATDYLHPSTTIQLVLAIKLWKRSVLSNGIIKRRMLFMQFSRSAAPFALGGFQVPDLVVSFGTMSITDNVKNALLQWGVPGNAIRGGYHSTSNDGMCSMPNQAPYVVTLPTNLLFFGATFLIPQVIANGVNLDLYKVQETGLQYDI